MRRATDSDMHPATSSSQHPVSLSSQHPFTSSSQHPVTLPSQHPVASRVLAAIGQPSSVSPTTPRAEQHSCDDTQPLGAAKVQRSLTWTAEGQMGARWGTEGESGGIPKDATGSLQGHFGSSPKRVSRESEGQSGGDLKGSISASNGTGSMSTVMADTTMQQQHQQQQQQQHHSLLGVNVQVSTTIEEATSLQSSPNVQHAPRHGAVLHRQRLAGSAAAGLHESASASSNSGQVVVPARFRAGTLALLCDAPVRCIEHAGFGCNYKEVNLHCMLRLCGELTLAWSLLARSQVSAWSQLQVRI